MTDYSTAPTSISEAKALRNDDASAWTPRDTLVAMLREIDAGTLLPTDLVVAYRAPQGSSGDRVFYGMYRSGSNDDRTIALLEYAKADILNGVS